MPSKDSSAWLLFGSSVALTLAAKKFRARRKKRRGGNGKDNDDHYLKRAHALRRSLTKPAQSRFRVVAILLLDNGDVICGANDEAPPTISGSICAERAALLQYRVQYQRQADMHATAPSKDVQNPGRDLCTDRFLSEAVQNRAPNLRYKL